MIISDKIYINKKELGEHLQALCDLFIYNNPEYYQKKKLKLSVANVFDKLYHYQFDGITLSLPRGSLEKVKQFYREHNLPFRYKDERIEHKPINVKLHDTTIEPQQRKIIDLLIKNEGGMIESVMASGKCLGYGTKIIMFNGSIKEVQDIKIGDILMGDDSTPRTVLETTIGKDYLYKIKPIKGMEFKCNENHILTLKYTNGGKGKSKKRRELDGKIVDISVKDFLLLPKYLREEMKSLRTGVFFPTQNINIDPYFLGLWLGDGNSRNTCITTGDVEIKNKCIEIAKQYDLKIRIEIFQGCENIFLTAGNVYDPILGRRRNKLFSELQEYNLILNKHIPKEYLYNDENIRLQLLAGLIDSDGYTNEYKNAYYCIALKNTPLVWDILYLIRSLGFYASYKIYKIKNTKFKSDNEYVKIHISGDVNKIPVKLERKKCQPRKQKKNHLVSMINVEKCTDIENYYGFILNGNGRFLLEDFTITHNSIAMLGLISEIKQPTIILLHEHRLCSQWVEEIEKRLKGKYKLGQLHGDIKEHGDITVGLIQTINRMFDEDVHCLDKYGMVIIDEGHHVNSNTYLKVINNLPAKYRISVTGTVVRKDSKEILSYDVIGKPLISIKAEDIKHRVTNFRFEIINTNIPMEIAFTERWTGQRREPVIDFTKTLSILTQNEERNAIIISKVLDAIREGHTCLILSDRVEHNKNLHKMLTELGIMSILLIGETRKKVKWDEIRNDKTIQVIVANTSIASEGLDLPRLSALFLTCPSSNYPKLSQRIGRIRRHIEEKIEPVVYDFVDNLAYSETVNGKSYLLRHIARKRIKLYQNLINDYKNGK
jgi:hypothetical protein